MKILLFGITNKATDNLVRYIGIIKKGNLR